MSGFTGDRGKTPLHSICSLEAIYELELKPIETEVLENCPLQTGFVTEKWVGRTEVTEVFVRWGAALTGKIAKSNSRSSLSSELDNTEWTGELKNLKERLNRLATNTGVEDSLDELCHELDCEENDSTEIMAEPAVEKLGKLITEEENTMDKHRKEHGLEKCDSRDMPVVESQHEQRQIRRSTSIKNWQICRDISEEKSDEEESGIHINGTGCRENSREISHENFDTSSRESGQTSMETSETHSEDEESGIDDSSEISVLEVQRLHKKNEKKLEKEKYVVPETTLHTYFENRETKECNKTPEILEKENFILPEPKLQTYFEKRDNKDLHNTQEKFLSDNNVQLRRRGSKKAKRSNTRPVNIALLDDWKNLDLNVPVEIGIQDKEKKHALKDKLHSYQAPKATVDYDNVVILRNSVPLRPRTPYPGIPCFDEQQEGEERISRGGWLYAYPDLTKDHIHTYAAKNENGTYWQMPFRHNLFSDLVNSNKSHRDSDGNLDSSSFKHDQAWFDALDAATFAPTGDIYSYFQQGNSPRPYGAALKEDSKQGASTRLRSAMSV